MATAFIDRALAEIDGLHHVLQAWFRAEGRQDPGRVLSHFDDGFTMITPIGTLTTLDALRGSLADMWGSRTGLVMEIAGKTVRHSGPGFAVLTYTERQHLGGAFTDRFSTALMLDRGTTLGPAWRHLQETIVA